MSSRRDTQTLDLFALIPKAPAPVEGAFGCGIDVRAALNRAIKTSQKTRYEIASRMSELVGADVSKTQLDSWTAESRDGWRFPLEYAAAFEVATDSHALLELLAEQRGCLVLVGEEALVAELGKLEQESQRIKSRQRLLREMVGRGR